MGSIRRVAILFAVAVLMAVAASTVVALIVHMLCAAFVAVQ